MRFFDNDAVRRRARGLDLAGVIHEAFASMGRNETALLPRQRISAAGTKLSTMAAILPEMGVAGAKVYTTVEGRFAFVVLLFDHASGRPLATFEADAFTELRTAATTVVAARVAGCRAPEALAVFGTGVQAASHIRAFGSAFPPGEVRVVSRADAGSFCATLSAETGLPVRQCDPGEAVHDAGMVITATRARTPLFDGAALAPGAFVAAVGSTLPDTREIDSETVRHASLILVEDRGQCLAEAGGLILAEAEGALDPARIRTIAEAMAETAGEGSGASGRGNGIVLFESVGIALEDVAVAAAIYRAADA